MPLTEHQCFECFGVLGTGKRFVSRSEPMGWGAKASSLDYEKRQPFCDTHFLEGFYTRFGSVEELVEVKDNAVAIFGAGEGIHLEFKEPAVPLKQGWTRIFVLETNGWCKDMDLYTQTGETVEPVPHIGNRDNHIERLHCLYNTRYLSGRQ